MTRIKPQLFREWLEQKATADDFPDEDVQLMASIIGVPAMLQVLESFQGTSIRFPSAGVRCMARQYIRKHYRPGVCLDKMAKDIGIARATLYRILEEKKEPEQTQLIEEVEDVFEIK